MDFDHLVSVPLGGYFLDDIPFHPASSIPFMSMLDYIANVSLSGYLVLYSLFFLYAAPSAQASHIRDGVFLLLSNLLGFIHKAFLLLYNKNDSFSIDTSSYKKFLINSSSSTTVHNDSLLDTALYTTTVTGTTTGDPTTAPQIWVDLHQIYFDPASTTILLMISFIELWTWPTPLPFQILTLGWKHPKCFQQ